MRVAGKTGNHEPKRGVDAHDASAPQQLRPESADQPGGIGRAGSRRKTKGKKEGHEIGRSANKKRANCVQERMQKKTPNKGKKQIRGSKR